MSEDKKTRKIISIIVILAFVFQFSNIVLLYAQEDNEVLNQFNKAKRAYLSRQYVDSRNILERIIDIINTDPERKTILGKCYLLLGVIYEKEGKAELAMENYLKARDLGVESIPDVKIGEPLLYLKIMKFGANSQKSWEGGKIEKTGGRKKKFTTLIVVGAVVVVVVVLAILLLKKPKYTLTATRGDGIDGTPTSGKTTYKKGSTVSYNYSLQTGYANLVVTLDGSEIAPSGTFKMYSNHTLIATSNRQYTLTVTKGTGVDGTPNTGTTNYNDGVIVNYNYTLQNGYSDLVVTIDGSSVAANGNITMNTNHTLTAGATVSKPIVTINSPQNNSSFPRGTIVTINVTVTSIILIEKIELYIDGALLETDTISPYSFTWHTLSFLVGPHTIRALAYDTGQRTGEVQITLTITAQ